MRAGRAKSLLLIVGIVGMAAPRAEAALITDLLDYVIFGHTSTDIGNSLIVNSGMIGSNGDVDLGNTAVTLALAGGGAFDGGNDLSVTGDVTFNGDVEFGNNGSLMGDVDSGGDVSGGNGSDVTGDVTAAGTITFGTGSTVGGTQTAGGTPSAFVPVGLPTPTVFVAGGPDVTKGSGESTTLLPGVHGDLSLGNTNVLNLSAGTYSFDSIDVGNGLDLNLDLSGGDIGIFVVGDIDIGNSLETFLLGGGTAEQFYVETHGAWGVGNFAEWFGTVYAPFGDVAFGNSIDITGALYSGGDASCGNSCTFTLAPANYLQPTPVIPEPASLLLFGIGGMAAALGRSWHGSA